jgi:hypothetical protein
MTDSKKQIKTHKKNLQEPQESPTTPCSTLLYPNCKQGKNTPQEESKKKKTENPNSGKTASEEAR